MIIDSSSDTPCKGEAGTTHIDHRVRERAYLLWEAEGRQDGGADEYWHRARERINAESQSAYPPAQSSGHRS